MAINIAEINQSGVEISVSGDVVTFKGSIDCPTPGTFLNPFFKDLEKQIISNGLKNVKVDITNLNFLNSSGIRELVDWVMNLSKVPEAQRYNIEVITNPDQVWQESSMSTLVYLNPKNVKKTVAK